MDYNQLIIDFERKYKRGFLESEIKILLSQYPNANLKKFNDALLGCTYEITDDNEQLIYLSDVLSAFTCAIENRNLKDQEWD